MTTSDTATARQLFELIRDVFDEDGECISAAYVAALVERESFIAIAAFDGAELIGGLTAHVLPMTASECAEIFVYDVAVKAGHRRKGAGSSLFDALFKEARSVNARNIFVPADNHDTHAIDFYRALRGQPRVTTEFTWWLVGHASGD